jgi:hypothetical protein
MNELITTTATAAPGPEQPPPPSRAIAVDEDNPAEDHIVRSVN